MQHDLDLSHLEPQVRVIVYALAKKHWPVFDKNGVFVPVKHYNYVIGTGDSQPIAVKKDSLWAKGDFHHEEDHCCPQESWPDTPNH
jgi:hypothetical protein